MSTIIMRELVVRSFFLYYIIFLHFSVAIEEKILYTLHSSYRILNGYYYDYCYSACMLNYIFSCCSCIFSAATYDTVFNFRSALKKVYLFSVVYRAHTGQEWCVGLIIIVKLASSAGFFSLNEKYYSSA